MQTDRWRPWPLGTAQELSEKGLGPEEIGAYFALGNDPQTGISGVVLNADLVRRNLGLAHKKWNRIIWRLVKTGFLIPSRDVKGLFLIPLMSSFACRNPNQYLHAFRSIQGLPVEIVSAWMGIYGKMVPETVPETKREPEKKDRDSLRLRGGASPRPLKTEEPSPVKGLVASFAENWKAKNPGAPFSGGAALGKFLKSALRELENAKAPDPPGAISRAIDAWFNPPPDLHSYAMSVSWGWEPFTRKYPELLRRVRYEERPSESSIRRL